MTDLMKKWLWGSAGFFLSMGLVLHAPLAKADPHPWSHGWLADHDHEGDEDGDHHWHKHKRMYQYYYYPAQQVYYSPVKQVYYYQSNGAWIYNAAPPASIQLGNKVRIDLGSPVPYVEHPYVIQQYPAVIVR